MKIEAGHYRFDLEFEVHWRQRKDFAAMTEKHRVRSCAVTTSIQGKVS